MYSALAARFRAMANICDDIATVLDMAQPGAQSPPQTAHDAQPQAQQEPWPAQQQPLQTGYLPAQAPQYAQTQPPAQARPEQPQPQYQAPQYDQAQPQQPVPQASRQIPTAPWPDQFQQHAQAQPQAQVAPGQISAQEFNTRLIQAQRATGGQVGPTLREMLDRYAGPGHSIEALKPEHYAAFLAETDAAVARILGGGTA